MINILNFSHILGLAIWLGSMVTWAMFAPKLSTLDPTKNTTDTLREIFTKLSWSSFGLALISGIGILILSEESSSNWALSLGLLVLAGLIIFLHSYVPNLSYSESEEVKGRIVVASRSNV